jgi:hypothetical protein
MRFYAWDPAKAASNFRKHGIRFDEAIGVFDDPTALTTANRFENGEQRWQTIGRVGDGLVLFVAHTEDEDSGDEIVRVISARSTTRQERRRYEEAIGSHHRR